MEKSAVSLSFYYVSVSAAGILSHLKVKIKKVTP